LTEIQQFEQAIQDLRRERHGRSLARPEEEA
jgi:hypothetical protein